MVTHWTQAPVQAPDKETETLARSRQGNLTKPPGSLGALEELAVRLAGLQGTPLPSLEKIAISIFAADHGIATEGVSAFPQAVTAEMIRNFSRGGAAISVLAKELGATLEVVNLGTVAPIEDDLTGVVDEVIAAGTRSFLRDMAMSESEMERALKAGMRAAERAGQTHAQAFIGGDMGIGNTTSSAAIYASLLGISAEQACGPGTGLDETGVKQKARILQDALDYHGSELSPRQILQYLGGFEIAALTGAYLRSAQLGIPVLVDGYIATAAALLANAIQPAVRDWFIFTHRSAEPAHTAALERLQAQPLLDLGMRLGEGSGAAVAAGVIRSALALHCRMATFSEAGVSGKV